MAYNNPNSANPNINKLLSDIENLKGEIRSMETDLTQAYNTNQQLAIEGITAAIQTANTQLSLLKNLVNNAGKKGGGKKGRKTNKKSHKSVKSKSKPIKKGKKTQKRI